MGTIRPVAAARRAVVPLALVVLVGGAGARSDEPVVTVLADYEDDSVAARITAVEGVRAADCSVSTAAIPARGQRALKVEIGATQPGAAAACDLGFRVDTAFDQADRIATHAWITQGRIEVHFRVRDARGRTFETPAVPIAAHNRWVRLAADLSGDRLHPAGTQPDGANAGPTWPIMVLGYRIRTHAIGRQTVYLDDLEVEHRVGGAAVVRGEFRLDAPTHIYEPGATVRATVLLENTSRQRPLPLSLQLAWRRADGTELASARSTLSLPAGSAEFRSRQPVDFAQRIDEPGLYRLLALVRGPGWTTTAVFETSIAVMYTNRGLPRGRATFFGLQTNLLREPPADQLLELDVAREIGAQLVALETPWRLIQPAAGSFDYQLLDTPIERLTRFDIAALLVLTDPPDWLPPGRAALWEQQALLLETLARRYGKRVSLYQPWSAWGPEAGGPDTDDLAQLKRLRQRIQAIRPEADLVAPALPVTIGGAQAAAFIAESLKAGVTALLETGQSSRAAVAALRQLAADGGLTWSAGQRWRHRSEPLIGLGAEGEAADVMQYYIDAARAGVGGALWFDLRDDTSDPRHPELMRGMLRRDFSPKAWLLGLANAVGMLQGLLYAGPVAGTPPEFDSAIFIGGQRQVAVLLPRPNRALPAVVAPSQSVPGTLAAFDFHRRPLALLSSSGAPLVATQEAPFFLTLDTQRGQAQPQLTLTRPWLRLPATVFCAGEGTFRVEIDAPTELTRSYFQLLLPEDAPVEVSPELRQVRAKAGQTTTFDIRVRRKPGKPLDALALSARLNLEGSTIDLPVAVQLLTEVRPLGAASQIADPGYRIGQLAALASVHGSPADEAGMALHAGYRAHELHLALLMPDDVPPAAFVRVRVAAEGLASCAVATIEDPAGRPRLRLHADGTTPQDSAWQCSAVEIAGDRRRMCRLIVPGSGIGLGSLAGGTRLLLGVSYEQPGNPARSAAGIRAWDPAGYSRSSPAYRWIVLAGE